MPTHDELARRRAKALADAKAASAGADARVEDLRDDLAEAEYLREIAENALAAVTVHGAAHRRVFVPGDDEPTGDELVLASLSGGGIFYSTGGAPAESRWRQIGHDSLRFRWTAVLADAPLIDVSGPGATTAASVDLVSGGAR